jgi:hypothetical protein
VSKILYRKNLSLYGEPKRTVDFDRFGASRSCEGRDFVWKFSFGNFQRPRARRGLKKTRGSSSIYPGSSEPASDPTRVRRAGPFRPDLVFVITLREIVPIAGPKNALERRPLRFSTICARNLELNLNIDKVTVILL